MLWFLGLFVSMLTSLFIVYYLIYSGIYWLAERNMFWTIKKEGTSKQVMYAGKFYKSLLAKKGYKFDDDWSVVPLDPKDKEESSGLSWVGIYPFFTIHEGPVKYLKALPDGTYEARDDVADFLLMRVVYQYALVAEGVEDKDKLPLTVQMVMTAQIVNPYKALWATSDWFDTLVNFIRPRVRQFVSERTYDDLISSQKSKPDQGVLKMLNEKDQPHPFDPSRGNVNILFILKEKYGIDLLSLETVKITPPGDYLEATLRKFNAVQTKDAEVEAVSALDTIIDNRIKNLASRLRLTEDEMRDYLINNLEHLTKIEDQSLNLFMRDQAKVRDIRFANADGSSLNPIHAALASLVELAKGGQPSGSSGGATGKSGGKKKNPKPGDDDDDDNGGGPFPLLP